jgi:hypothetical protein
MAGWIKIYRTLKDHWLFDNPAYLKAWIVLLMDVNYEDSKTCISGELIECKRGQAIYSLKTWTERLGKGWTIQKVRTFFNLLENDAMIKTEGLRKTTRLTICKYDTYQDVQQGDNKETTRRQHSNNKEITTSKEGEEGKERKEVKKKGFVAPTFEEFLAYAKTLPTYKPSMEFKVQAKFSMWEDNGWKDGYDKPIKNWKSKLQTAITYFVDESAKNVYANPYKIQ